MTPELKAVAEAIKLVKEGSIEIDRLLYVVNWIVSKQLQLNKEFDTIEFYNECGFGDLTT